jgi:exopolyphosphatase / guanosine-5'-triphosphate,3'-diphosphate pyrophosphatase
MSRYGVARTAIAPARSGWSPDAVSGDLLAALDLGSNSFRLEIGQMDGAGYKRVAERKSPVRLGAGLNAQGQLSDEAIERGLECLKAFAPCLEGFDSTRVRAVATQTLREAANRDAFLRRAAAALGFPIEVISGREEARLIYAGVHRLAPAHAGRRLVVDVGGRSTEMILGEGCTPLATESFGVGSFSLSMRFFPEGRFEEDGFAGAQLAAGAAFEESLATFAAPQWTQALGASGIVGAISRLLAIHQITDGSITQAGLHWCVEQCLTAGHARRLALPGLREDRKMILGGGLAIMLALSTQFGVSCLRPAKGALRQGLIFDLHDRRCAAAALGGARDPRLASVHRLKRQFRVDAQQADRVKNVAHALYASIEPRATAERRAEVQWAADLHEIGMMVSHHDHHRHSAYLLAHVEAPGFSQSQLRRLGTLVLGQRGNLRKLCAALAEPALVSQLVALRLAVLLCHARQAPLPQPAGLQRLGRNTVLSLPGSWVQQHAHNLYLLEQERLQWERSDMGRLMIEIIAGT